ncbi:MAG: transglutaminase domain-containing protein [Bacteroidia bacterium]
MILLLSFQSFGQKEIILKRTVNIDIPGLQHVNESCDYELLVPANRPGKQDIVQYEYSFAPENLSKTPGNEILAEWKQLSFSQLEKTKIEALIRIKIYSYDLTHAKKNPVLYDKDIDTLKYLGAEEDLQVKSKKIKDAAKNITGNSREEIVHAIFNFVLDNMEYKKNGNQDRGAKGALIKGEGNATEYTELMVALCRAKKIPSRIEYGLFLSGAGQVGHHNWVEVYFPMYGWVSFDPTMADHYNSSTSFDTMQNIYIQLSNRASVKNIFSPCSFSYKIEDSYRFPYADSIIKQQDLFEKMYALYSSKELEKADQLLDTLLNYKPNLYDYYSYKGLIRARCGDFDNGLQYMQTSLKNAISTNEKSLSLYAFSNYFALKGDKEYAVMYLKKSIELGFKGYTHLIEDEDFEKMRDYQPLIDIENELKSNIENKKQDQKK